MTLYDLIHLLKGPVSKYSHILRFWGAKISRYQFEGDTVQSITPMIRLNQMLSKVTAVPLFLHDNSHFLSVGYQQYMKRREKIKD